MYDEGRRYTCSLFAAFSLPAPVDTPARIGFTTPRALGKAVVRNRVRRRLREAIRVLGGVPERYWIVFNPRRSLEAAPLERLRAEVTRYLSWLKPPA